MFSQPKVSFLQEKIMELQQALFFDLGSSVLKLSTSVINVLHVDEIGQVWFFITRPTQNISEFESEFRSRLDFYRKGKNFYIHLLGKGCMVTDPEEINCVAGLAQEYKEQANNNMLLVRFKIDQIFYYPTGHQAPVIKSEGLKTSLQPSALIKTLQYIVKDIIPVFQSH